MNLSLSAPNFTIGQKVYFIIDDVIYTGTILEIYLAISATSFDITSNSSLSTLSLSDDDIAYTYKIETLDNISTYDKINQSVIFLSKSDMNTTITTETEIKS